MKISYYPGCTLKNNAKKLKIKTPVIDAISNSYLHQVERAIKLIKSIKKKKVGFLGITFKSGTDDIRGNPALLVLNRLANEGYNVKIFDRIINESDIKMINKNYRKEVYDMVNKGNLKEKIKNKGYKN